MYKRSQFKQQQHCLKIFFLVLLLSLNIISTNVLASEPHITETEEIQNEISPTSIKKIDLINIAKQWGLSEKDYKQYLWLMKNTSSRKWYPTLDPSEVLALNTNSENEMLKYAKIQAQNMHVRVTRELAFDIMYAKAYHTLYPEEKPIMSSTES